MVTHVVQALGQTQPERTPAGAGQVIGMDMVGVDVFGR